MSEIKCHSEISSKTNRITCFNSFDLLRFFAAISIACFLHFNNAFIKSLKIPNPFESNRLLYLLSTQSGLFVELFFIISGILFIHAYYPKIGKSILGKEQLTFDHFLINRIIRIYPVAILTASVMFLTECILYSTYNPIWRGNIGLDNLMLNWIFGGGTVLQIPYAVNGPAWYLSVLMGCYVLAYPLSVLHKKTSIYFLWMLPICFGIVFVCNNYHIAFISHDWGRGLVAFFEGCIFEFMRQKITLTAKSKKIFQLMSLIIILGSFGYMYSQTNSYKLIHSLTLYHDFYIFPALIFLVINCQWINKVCSNKVIRELGNISYGIYLWNFPIFAIIFLILRLFHIAPSTVTNHWFIIWSVILLTHIIVGLLSYHAYEKIIVSKLKKLFK